MLALSSMTRVLGTLALASAVAANDDTIRSHNFGAGPAALPDEVLRRARDEFLNFKGTGLSILEWTNLDAGGFSHPGVAAPGHKLQEMMLDTESKLRTALSIPETYRVLFMHGGAVAQFSAVPMNLLGGESAKADYLASGFWSNKSATEASKYGDIHKIPFSGESLPAWDAWARASRADSAYLHVCLSETVQGVELRTDPNPKTWAGPPVVLDATSTLLSRPIDVSAYSLVYASGGKNIPAGMAVVIARASFLQRAPPLPHTPMVLDYRQQAGALLPSASVFESRPNTPPTFAVYMLNLVLDHLESEGGVSGQDRKVQARADKLYAAAAAAGGGGFYINAVHPSVRSRMNAIFKLPTRELETLFVNEAEAAGLHHLYGHPISGGIRITMYNWVRDESVAAVVDFMVGFADKHASVNTKGEL